MIDSSLAKILKEEHIGDDIVIGAIREHSSEKITYQIVEQYKAAVLSRELTNDPIILNILESTNKLVSNKYIFIIENTPVILSKETLTSLDTLPETIEDLKEWLKQY